MSLLQFHAGRGSGGSWLVRVLVVAGACLTASPSQAAEALPPVVLDIGVSLLAAPRVRPRTDSGNLRLVFQNPLSDQGQLADFVVILTTLVGAEGLEPPTSAL